MGNFWESNGERELSVSKQGAKKLILALLCSPLNQPFLQFPLDLVKKQKKKKEKEEIWLWLKKNEEPGERIMRFWTLTLENGMLPLVCFHLPIITCEALMCIFHNKR